MGRGFDQKHAGHAAAARPEQTWVGDTDPCSSSRCNWHGESHPEPTCGTRALDHDECGSCRMCWRSVVSLKGAKDVVSKKLASKAPEIILKRVESESWRRYTKTRLTLEFA